MNKVQEVSRWYEIRNEASKPAEVLIYDVIGKETDWFSGEETGIGAQDFIEEVKALGEDREIVVGINSPGGNVWDGLAIYNFLINRKGKVKTRNDGLAGSISSVILMAGKDGIEAPETSQVMIHDPATIAAGGIEDLQKSINALTAAKKSILATYTKKTRRGETELSAMMTAETWMSGKEAHSLGFVDAVTKQNPIFNTLDLSRFKRVPESLREVSNKTAASAAGKHQQLNTQMDITKIVALLKKHGAVVDEKSTHEQLEAQLEALLGGKIDDKGGKDDAAGAAAIKALHSEVDALKAKHEDERKARITRSVEDLITEGRVTVNEKEKAIARSISDETYLAELKDRPVVQAGPAPGPVIDLVSASMTDVLKHVQTLSASNTERTVLLRKNHDKIVNAWHDPKVGLTTPYKLRNEGTNSIDTTLKQDVLYDQALKAFAKILAGLSAFSTKFENVPLRGTAKIQVPYIALQSAASTAWNASNGYVGGDTATDNREVTIDQRYYQAIRFTMEEFNRQPYLLLADHMRNNGEKLAYDVWINLLGAVTVAAYAGGSASGGSAYAGAASAFDSDDLADLQMAANLAQWPIPGRSLFLNATFDNALKKDNALKSALNAGTNSVTSRGTLEQMIYGFNYVMNSNIPTNSENLAGFICHSSALLVATAPIAPNEDLLRAGLNYSVLTDPDLGISMEVRRFGVPQMDRAYHVIECNWGKAAGVETALQRIITA